VSNGLEVFLLTLTAGLMMAVGGLLAGTPGLPGFMRRSDVRHGIVAFGGGALLAAVALVLVPEGMENIPPSVAAVCFVAGALVFMALDVVLARRGTPASQLVAMLADFIPESLALGASVAAGGHSAPLLALIIGLQNLPEGFNSFHEIHARGDLRARRIILMLLAASLFGPLFGLTGFFLLSDQPTLVHGIMLFAAGVILYLIFQDIAPQTRLDNHWTPPLGAVLGFLLGMMGEMVM